MKYNESDIIKICAALTSSPRWITALMLADGAVFSWGNEAWWQITSALLSVLFAVVEVYATGYMMKAWRETKSEVQSKRLFVLWVSTLVVLVAVMSPSVYVNVSHSAFDSLPLELRVVWSICVSASVFLVIGGVGYAERAKSEVLERNLPKPTEAKSESETGAKRKAKSESAPSEKRNWSEADFAQSEAKSEPSEAKAKVERATSEFASESESVTVAFSETASEPSDQKSAPSEAKFVCKICGHVATSQNGLNGHYKRHKNRG
jgi:hypothetical protein